MGIGPLDTLSTFTTFRRISMNLDSKTQLRLASDHPLELPIRDVQAIADTIVLKSVSRSLMSVIGKTPRVWTFERKKLRQRILANLGITNDSFLTWNCNATHVLLAIVRVLKTKHAFRLAMGILKATR